MTTSLDQLRHLRACLPDFAQEYLKIRTKAGEFLPLQFNTGQCIVHAALEAQKAEFGWCRAMVLKQRQGGISTYIAGRYYHRTSLNKGVNTYILSHEQSTSDALFGIVDRYNRSNPLAPHVGTSNAKELVFDRLDSSYQVATAGGTEGGRGRTISLFHGSEAAFWKNAPAHFAASVQAVPLEPGTEVILESTSAGPSGEYYERWQDAEAGLGDYIPIFLPWFVSAEYSREAPAGFELATDSEEGVRSEREYAEMHQLSLGQMAWRRAKIIELRSANTFMREYPADVSEAWTATGDHEPFIDTLLVLRARKRERTGAGPLIIGVDPASGGGDRFAVAWRRGDKVLRVKWRNKIDTLEATAWLKSIIDEFNPARMNIDAGNIGQAVVTNLKALGPRYVDVVRGVNFGATSQAKQARPKIPGPKNRRAEMWLRMKEWLESETGVQLPDENVIQSDITAPRRKPSLTNDTVLESKDDMRLRRIRSPDIGDAIALTFASSEFFASYQDDLSQGSFGLPDAPRQVTNSGFVPAPAGPGGWMS